MKLSPICNINFKGLWGQGITTQTYATEHSNNEYQKHSIDKTMRFYYPFKDETEQEINEAISKHISVKNYGRRPGHYELVVEQVKVRRLPFTKAQWQAYLKIEDAKMYDRELQETIKRNATIHCYGRTCCKPLRPGENEEVSYEKLAKMAKKYLSRK